MSISYEAVRLTFKNFMQVGNKPMVIEFDQGFMKVIGENGAGKSTILNALTYALKGVPHRADIKLKNLVNWINNKNMEVEHEFKINSIPYKIRRCRKPDSVTVWKNGRELDEIAGKSNAQVYIDSIIQIDIKLLKELICLDWKKDKFLELKTAPKREYLERSFNMEQLRKIIDSIKSESSEFRSDMRINDTEVDTYKSIINDLKIRLKDAQANSSEKLGDLNKELLQKTEELKETFLKKKKLDKAKDLIEAKIQYEMISQLEEQIEEISTKITKTESSKNAFKFQKERDIQELQGFIDDGKCPTCHRDYDNLEEMQKRIDSINEEIHKNSEGADFNIDLLQGELDQAKNTLSTYDESLDKIDKIKNKLIDIESDVRIIHSDVKSLKTRISEFQENDLTSELDSQIKDNEILLEKAQKKVDESKAKLNLNAVSVDSLGESGYKSFLMGKIIPKINSKIREYITKFDIPYSLSLDNELNETIIHRYMNKQVDYGNLSDGQRAMLDIVILFAFWEVSKILTGWKSNLIFLDEVVDGNLSPRNYDNAVSSIRNFCINNDYSTWFISHKSPDDKMFDGVLEILKVSEFTEAKFHAH